MSEFFDDFFQLHRRVLRFILTVLYGQRVVRNYTRNYTWKMLQFQLNIGKKILINGTALDVSY